MGKPTVYIVTTGEYDSYQIAGVFTSQGEAQKLVEIWKRWYKKEGRMYSPAVQIEELELDPEVEEDYFE